MALTAVPVGFIAGLFGIGGGLIMVPFLFYIFESLNIDASLIVELKTQLNSIRISDLKNLNIAQELAEERLSIIVRFIDSAK